MEFPDLGQHCSHMECKRLDFLPLKCDLCENIYCLDHFRYESHSCANAYQKDVQVPICPLCNAPVPVKRGELPDIRVGQHIDLDCESDPAIKKRNQIYRNKCSVKGCKQKEFMQLVCTECGRNHCLKHRHPADHKCEPSARVSTAGSAALKRMEENKRNVWQKSVESKSSQMNANSQTVRTHSNAVLTAVQGNYTEDEALARALQQSMNELGGHSTGAAPTQYDRDLAKAIEESQRNANRNKDKCSIS